jgi:hypothetical protein
MMGRKLEEDDWTSVYCEAKDIPKAGWSNLDIDVTHGNLGIEHKMLGIDRSNISDACGSSFMHPALTRSIRIDDMNRDADEVKNAVFTQYAELLDARRKKISEQDGSGRTVELRTGWLLWQRSLREFLYFEELAIAPDPDGLTARWVDRPANGSRKPSRNLWIYDKVTLKKRYSVTTSAGIKIQPYFDVPQLADPNLYRFTVFGEALPSNDTRMWVTPRTANALREKVGSLESDAVTTFLDDATTQVEDTAVESGTLAIDRAAVPVIIPQELYTRFVRRFPGFSDDDSISTMLAHFE